jgi:hypothetical protein
LAKLVVFIFARSQLAVAEQKSLLAFRREAVER